MAMKKQTATERFEIQCLDFIAGKADRPSLGYFLKLRNQLGHIGQGACAIRLLAAYRATIKHGQISRTISTPN